MDKETVNLIDGLLLHVVDANNLPDPPSWLNIKEKMAISKLLSLEELEKHRLCIVRKFYELRTKRAIEQINKDKAKLLGEPIHPEPASVKDSEASNKESVFDGSSEDSETDEEDVFEPALDTTSTDNRSRYMCIYVNGRWAGAALGYCHDKESFVSPRIVKRHRLEIVDGQVELTWKFNEVGKTYVTQFFVRENMVPDFMLGIKSTDELSDKENASPISNTPRPLNGLLDQAGLPFHGPAHNSTQVWLNQVPPGPPVITPNPQFMAEMVYHLGVLQRQTENLDPTPYYLPQPPAGIIVEDARSSVSGGPIRGSDPGGDAKRPRRKHSKTQRSNSKSTS